MKGIGYEVARDLLRRGCRLWIACRDPKRGEQIAQRLREEISQTIEETAKANDVQSGSPDSCSTVFCRFLHMDLCSLQSVRQAVRELTQNEEKLDILINNAAIIGEFAF